MPRFSAVAQVQARFDSIRCTEVEHGGTAAEAQCLQNACSQAVLQCLLIRVKRGGTQSDLPVRVRHSSHFAAEPIRLGEAGVDARGGRAATGVTDLTTAWKGSSYGPFPTGGEFQVSDTTYIPEEQFDHEAAKALGLLVENVISLPGKRHDFREDPIGTAAAAGVDITDKTKRVILTLAEMSPSELRLLSDLNRLLIAEGLYVETGNPPLMVY